MDSTPNIPLSPRKRRPNHAPLRHDLDFRRFSLTYMFTIVPTATTQVVLTQIFAPVGRTEELNALSAYVLGDKANLDF